MNDMLAGILGLAVIEKSFFRFLRFPGGTRSAEIRKQKGSPFRPFRFPGRNAETRVQNQTRMYIVFLSVLGYNLQRF